MPDRRILEDWKPFITSGKAIFTIENTETGGRFTFKVKQSNNGKVFYVSVLAGPDNMSNYTYIGTIMPDGTFRMTRKSQVAPDSPSFKAFSWLNKLRLNGKDLPENALFWHEGRCGRCGRRLTVPESIETGYGPECASKMSFGELSGQHFSSRRDIREVE